MVTPLVPKSHDSSNGFCWTVINDHPPKVGSVGGRMGEIDDGESPGVDSPKV